MTGLITVTGGTGHLGRLIVRGLLAAGQSVRVVSRCPRPVDDHEAYGWARADLRANTGTAGAVAGSDVVVHCATSFRPSGDVAVARNVVAACQRAGVGHLLVVSIVGIDRVPFGYYRGKVAVEGLVERSGVPHTILRATQFHELVRAVFAIAAKSPVMPVPDISFQSVDVRVVAERMAQLALGPPAGRATEIGGPRVENASDLAREYLRFTGRRRLIWPVRLPGKAFRAFRAGGNLTPDHAADGITFAEYLGQLPNARRAGYLRSVR